MLSKSAEMIPIIPPTPVKPSLMKEKTHKLMPQSPKFQRVVTKRIPREVRDDDQLALLSVHGEFRATRGKNRRVSRLKLINVDYQRGADTKISFRGERVCARQSVLIIKFCTCAISGRAVAAAAWTRARAHSGRQMNSLKFGRVRWYDRARVALINCARVEISYGGNEKKKETALSEAGQDGSH